jgi:hypothetical protein
LEAKTRRTKAKATTTRKELVKKRNTIIESSSSFNNEVSLPLTKEKNCIVLEVAPKNDQQLVRFAKTKQ